MAYPLVLNFKNGKFVPKCCFLMYGLTAILITGFMITFRYVHDSVPFRISSPFADPTHSNVILTIATCVVLCLQFIVFFLNIVFSSKMIFQLKSSIGQHHFIVSVVVPFFYFSNFKQTLLDSQWYYLHYLYVY